MSRSPLTPIFIPTESSMVKPKTPHRVHADKIKALINEVICLRNAHMQVLHRLSVVEQQLRDQRALHANERRHQILKTET